MNNLFLKPKSNDETICNMIQSKNYQTGIPIKTINNDTVYEEYDSLITDNSDIPTKTIYGLVKQTLKMIKLKNNVVTKDDTITIKLESQMNDLYSIINQYIPNQDEMTIKVDLDTIDVNQLKEGDYTQLRRLVNVNLYKKIILKDLTENEKINKRINKHLKGKNETYTNNFKTLIEQLKENGGYAHKSIIKIEQMIEQNKEPKDLEILIQIRELLTKKIKNRQRLELIL